MWFRKHFNCVGDGQLLKENRSVEVTGELGRIVLRVEFMSVSKGFNVSLLLEFEDLLSFVIKYFKGY